MKLNTNTNTGTIGANHNETLVQANSDLTTTNKSWLVIEIQPPNIHQAHQWEETLASTLFGAVPPSLHPSAHPLADYRQSI